MSQSNTNLMVVDTPFFAEEQLKSNQQLILLQDKNIVALKRNILYVASGYAVDAGVISLEAYCKRTNIKIEKKFVSVDEIIQYNRYLAEDYNDDGKNSIAEQTFHEITCKAAKVNASDIHIIINKSSTIIKQRINGDLMEMHDWSLTNTDGRSLCSAIYTTMTGVAGRFYIPSMLQDASIPSENLHPSIKKKVNGIRVATTPTHTGEMMVLRLLYDIEGELGLDALGYSSKQIVVIESLKRHSTGLLLIVGPTGSGKSTTLKEILTSLNDNYDGRKHTITVEDPPESTMPRINQLPVTNADNAEERHQEFNKFVRGCMRLDPDIMMIGEIRDDVTAMLSLNAAMTGHWVCSTLHSNNALGSIKRLSILGIDISLMSEPSDFRGVISQRLVKTLCPLCRIPFSQINSDPKLIDYLDRSGLGERLKPILKDPHATIFFKSGCEYCDFTGRKGRTVVAEIFENSYNNPTMDLMIEKKWIAARASWLKNGGQSMMMHAIEKMKQGIIDPRAIEDVLDPIYIEKA